MVLSSIRELYSFWGFNLSNWNSLNKYHLFCAPGTIHEPEENYNLFGIFYILVHSLYTAMFKAGQSLFILQMRKMIFRETEELSMDIQLLYDVDGFNSKLYLSSFQVHKIL